MEEVLKSNLDSSVNFIYSDPVYGPGVFESRYVKRRYDDFICYLSSHTGCNRGCNFCHLTATGQTYFKSADYFAYFYQAKKVLDYAKEINDPGRYIKFSFMARGEVLANDSILDSDNCFDLFSGLEELALSYKRVPKFNMSTIMPKTLSKTLVDLFPLVHPKIYYSLYSVNPEFRKKWMPGAMEVDRAMMLLKEYQEFTEKPITIHYSLIKGENDDYDDAYSVIDLLEHYNLTVNINLVRYNSPDQTSTEADSTRYAGDLEAFSKSKGLKNIISINPITRVGFDINASCGMFVNASEY